MKSKTKPNIGPVTVAIPNTTSEKLKAICDVAESNKLLAQALASTNVDIQISDCTIVDAKGAGISIENMES